MVKKFKMSLTILFVASLFFTGFQFTELTYGGRPPEPWIEIKSVGDSEVAYGGRPPEPWIETKSYEEVA